MQNIYVQNCSACNYSAGVGTIWLISIVYHNGRQDYYTNLSALVCLVEWSNPNLSRDFGTKYHGNLEAIVVTCNYASALQAHNYMH